MYFCWERKKDRISPPPPPHPGSVLVGHGSKPPDTVIALQLDRVLIQVGVGFTRDEPALLSVSLTVKFGQYK